MTSYRAAFVLLTGLFLLSNLAAQEESFKRSNDDSLSFGADEQRPIVRDSGRLLNEDDEMVEEKKAGGFPWISLPKPKLPTLPKPSLPKLSLPKWSTTQTTTAKSRMQQQEPSTWEKLNSGTKSIFTKTKHTLMPWTADDEPSTARKKPSSTHRTARSSSTKSKTEKKPFFPSLFESKPAEKQSETVNDYLSLPRVPY